MLFGEVFSKICQIEVPLTNTSEMEKVHIRIVHEFYRVMQKVCCDYTSAILLSKRNYQYLENFINLTFDHLENGFDQHTKKSICTLLRGLQIDLNGVIPSQVAHINKRLPTNEVYQQLQGSFGSASLHACQMQDAQNILQRFN